MSLTEFDQEEYDRHRKEEGFAEGKLEGLAEGKLEGLAEGKLEGLAEGKLEGLAEGEKLMKQKTLETAKIALVNNIPIEMIIKLTNLTLEQVQTLKEEMFANVDV